MTISEVVLTEHLLTPAQKAAKTRAWNKAHADHEKRMEPVDAAYYQGACEPLYPARNAEIDAAEAQMIREIKEAEDRYEATRERVMTEFEAATAEALAIRDAAFDASWAILKSETGGRL